MRTREFDGYRFCSRCWKALTDPASVEAGVGPFCRNKDNHLYSKTIKGDYSMALMLVMGFTGIEELPVEVQAIFPSLKNRLERKLLAVTTIRDNFNAVMAGNVSGADFRPELKQIDWILSHSMTTENRQWFIRLVRLLGYVALAGVFSGVSSTGEATIGFNQEKGMLTLSGAYIKEGFKRLRSLNGSSLPKNRYATDRVCYVPAKFHQEFKEIVFEFWPCFEQNIDDVVDQAKAWLEANRTVVCNPPVAPGRPNAVINERPTFLVVSFPWLGSGTYQIVDAIKSRIVNRRERIYNPNDKTWAVTKNNLELVKEILSRDYDVVVR